MVQGRSFSELSFIFFFFFFFFFFFLDPTIQKALFKCLSVKIVIISEVLEHSFRKF